MMDDLVTENVELEQQLIRKKAEQTKADETTRREQQQMRQLEQVRGIFFLHSMFPSNCLSV